MVCTVKLQSLDELPSEARYSGNTRLQPLEQLACGVIGGSLALLFLFSPDLLTAVITAAVLLLSLAAYAIAASISGVSASKTFFTDYPVHGVCSMENATIAVTGGGGGMQYGIPDQCTIMKILDGSLPNSDKHACIAMHRVNGYGQPGTETLLRTKLSVLQSITPYSLWGVAYDKQMKALAGGIGGVLHVFKVSDQYDYELLGAHEMIVQPYKQKANLLLSICRVKGGNIAVAGEDGQCCLYSLENDILCLNWKTAYPKGSILDIQFTPNAAYVVVLTTKGSIDFFSTRGEHIEPTVTPGFAFAGCVRINKHASSWTKASQATAPPDTRHILLLEALNGNQNQCRLITIGKKDGRVFASCGEVALSPTPTYLGEAIRKNFPGLDTVPAVASSRNTIGLAGNNKFVIIDSSTLNARQWIVRCVDKSSSLPVTCATFSEDGRYFIVGSADYAVTIAVTEQGTRRIRWRSVCGVRLKDYARAILNFFFAAGLIIFIF